MKRSYVAVEPYRERYQQLERMNDMSFTEVARRMGWKRRKVRNDVKSGSGPAVVPDASRAKRTLGLADYVSQGRRQRRQKLQRRTAVRLCKALDMDPREGGL